MNSFEEITLENINEVQSFFKGRVNKFCDFTPFVALMWQKMYKTEYTVRDSVLYLRYTIDNKSYYATPQNDVYPLLDTLSSFPDFHSLTLVGEDGLENLKSHGVEFEAITDDSFHDYVYLWENLASLKGKKYAGQRNHINKFEALYPDWKYERVTSENVGEILEFFKKISSPNGNASHDFEADMVKNYLANFEDFETLGGFVRAGGNIVSFAFGEIIDDFLFVHIEKADRTVQGAYPIIVREFARDNPAKFINREEDMGIEGLRTSKLSYHPETLLKKYIVKIV